MDTALEARGGANTTIGLGKMEETRIYKTAGLYDMVSRPTETGRRTVNGSDPLAPPDADVQEKLGLTAGRGNSLAAHLLGVVICFD